MKLEIVKYVYEPPGLAIIPETDFEAAVLHRYWASAVLSKGKAGGESKSANGLNYVIKFAEPATPERPLTPRQSQAEEE